MRVTLDSIQNSLGSTLLLFVPTLPSLPFSHPSSFVNGASESGPVQEFVRVEAHFVNCSSWVESNFYGSGHRRLTRGVWLDSLPKIDSIVFFLLRKYSHQVIREYVTNCCRVGEVQPEISETFRLVRSLKTVDRPSSWILWHQIYARCNLQPRIFTSGRSLRTAWWMRTNSFATQRYPHRSHSTLAER